MSQVNPAPVEQTAEPVASAEETPKKDFVSLDTHKKLLDEKKKMQAKLEEFEAKQRELEELDARKRGDYEALVKARDEELKAEREKRMKLESTFVHGQKMNAVIDALGGNVDPRWFKLIDVSGVVLGSDGEVDALTVAKVAEGLKREFPEMVKSNSRLPAEAPKGNGAGKISRADWLKLPYAKMKEYPESQIVD